MSVRRGAALRPFQSRSRLGFPLDQLTPEIMEKFDGIHFHNLCEQISNRSSRPGKLFDGSIPVRRIEVDQHGRRPPHHPRPDSSAEELVEFLRDAKRTPARNLLEAGRAVRSIPHPGGTVLDTG